jgi:integrase
MEALHLKPKNFNVERGTVTFEVIKQRKAKRQFFAVGKSRTFFVSPKYIKAVKSYVLKKKIADNDYLFLDRSSLPDNYDALSNLEKKKFYQKTQINYSQMFKRHLKSIGMADWRKFSLHNIRKTYGNWMRIYDIRTEEICYRLGHDFQTYQTHYGSALIFTPQEKMQIMGILGEVK